RVVPLGGAGCGLRLGCPLEVAYGGPVRELVFTAMREFVIAVQVARLWANGLHGVVDTVAALALIQVRDDVIRAPLFTVVVNPAYLGAAAGHGEHGLGCIVVPAVRQAHPFSFL